jgi:hypothetical protein
MAQFTAMAVVPATGRFDAEETDKTFLIAESIRKVSWTGRSAAGVGSVKPGLVCRAAQFGLNC